MMKISTKAKKRFARGLRKHQTDAEKALWVLRLATYSPQQVIHGYIPDFYSKAFRTAIEVNGSVHNSREVKRRDKAKRKILRGNGVYTLRVSNTYAVRAPVIVLAEAILTGIIWRLWTMVRL